MYGCKRRKLIFYRFSASLPLLEAAFVIDDFHTAAGKVAAGAEVGDLLGGALRLEQRPKPALAAEQAHVELHNRYKWGAVGVR